MDNRTYFYPSLFPLEKGDFDYKAFEQDCLTEEFKSCIMRAINKSFDDLNACPTVDVITKLCFIHSRFYFNLEDEFALTYEESSPRCHYSGVGNERSFFTCENYVFIFNKKGGTKNKTAIFDVINNQGSDYHILSVEYIADVTITKVEAVEISYRRGNQCEYVYTIPNVNHRQNDEIIEQKPVQPILPKLKTKSADKKSS